MQIVIQNSGVAEYNARAVFDAANDLEIPTFTVGIVPFTYDFVGAENIDFSKPTFFYGSTRCLEIAKRDHDGPGVYINKFFDVLNQDEVRNDFLNIKPQVVSLKELAQENNRFVNYWKKLAEVDRPIFARPSSSLKLFAGGVFTLKDFDKKMSDVQNAAAEHPDEWVIYSTYKDIWAEWRFFIVDGSVITGSLYKESGRLEMRPASKDMLMIAQALASKWLPDPTCVMDLALTKNGIKVVEFNSVNSSGMYECDVKKILTAIQELIG